MKALDKVVSPMDTLLTQTDEEFEYLSSAVSKLQDRLGQVSSSVPDKGVSEDADPYVGSSPLVNRLTENKMKVRRFTRVLNDLLNSLEI